MNKETFEQVMGTPGFSSFPSAVNAAGVRIKLANLQRNTLDKLSDTERQDWKPLLDRLAGLEDIEDDAELVARLSAIRNDLPALIEQIYANSATATVFADSLAEAVRLGMQKKEGA